MFCKEGNSVFQYSSEMIFKTGYNSNIGGMLQMPLVKVGPVHLQVMGRDRLKIMRVKCVESSNAKSIIGR